MAQRKTTRKTTGKIRTSRPSTKKADASRKTKSSRPAAERGPKPAGDEEVTIDRRRAPNRRDEQEKSSVAPPKLERRKKVNRRRQIDPTTCERDYTDHEVEFMNALDDYKRKSGRMFPTCSEVLEVVRSLGYVKLSTAELASREDAVSPAAAASTNEWFAQQHEGEEAADEEAAFESAFAE